MRSRGTWLVFAGSAALAASLGAVVTMVRSLRDAKLLEVAALLLVVTSILLLGAILLAVALGPDGRVTLQSTLLGATLAMLLIAAGAVLPDPGHIGRLQQTLLGSSLLLAVFLTAAPSLLRRGHVDRVVKRLAGWGTRISLPEPAAPRRELIWGLLVVAVAAVAFFWLVSTGALGHDESAYAVKARAWREGTPDTGWGLHRPVGMAAVAWAVLALGNAELSLRVVGAIVSVLAIVAVWRVGRTLLSPQAGLATAVLLIGAPSFLRRAAEFLNDIGTTALVLLIVLLLWRHFENRDTSRWELVLAAPVAAGAFYLRYGVVSTYLVLLVAGGVLWRKQLRASLAPLLATAAALFVLVVPHVMYAMAKTGSPVGILTRATEAAGRDYLGGGLVAYLRWLPIELAGPVLGPVVAIGGLALAVALLRRGATDTPRRKAVLLLGTVGIGQLVLSGLFVHAEPRYVFLAIALLGLVGTQVLLDGWARLNRSVRRRAVAVPLAFLLALTAVNVTRAHTGIRDLAADRVVIEAAGEAIAASAAGGECLVMTSYLPQITWYSGCATVAFDLNAVPPPLLEGRALTDYLLFFANGKRQPEGALLDEYIDDVPTRLLTQIEDTSDTVGDARIYEVADNE
jgi:hypothetical protein